MISTILYSTQYRKDFNGWTKYRARGPRAQITILCKKDNDTDI